jgi:hypothetical protein
VQHQQVPSRGLEPALLERILKEAPRWRQMVEKRAPGPHVGLARALHDDVEEGREGGEERHSRWQQRRLCGLVLRGRSTVDFGVENVVQKHFERMCEVLEPAVAVREEERRLFVGLLDVVAQDLRYE